MFKLALLIYMVAIGFTIAGIVVHGYGLLSRKALRFDEPPATLLQGVFQTLIIVVGGPVLIAEWVLKAWLVDRRPAALAAIGLSVSGFWSFCSGLLLLNVVVAM